MRIYSQLLNTTAAPAWRQFGVERFSGVVAPVPFIHSQNSVGCGEFLDEILLLDFCKAVGAKALMELPVNPVGYAGSPYAAEDPFAFEPMLGSPIKMTDDSLNTTNFSSAISDLRKEFPTNTGRINYGLRSKKIDLFWKMFQSLKGNESPGFRNFVNRYKDIWLRDYTLYTVIKEKQEDKNKGWKSWADIDSCNGENLRDHDNVELSKFERTNSERVTFYAWLQWQLSMQRKTVRSHADSINRKIIADAQIFPSSDSTGPWAQREFFLMDKVAGAPTDPYAAKGQRWDSHPYNWQKLMTVGKKYIRAQQQYIYEHAHGRRYDHSIGVPRIWSIPFNAPLKEQGLPGKFDPDPEFRYKAGLDRYKFLFSAEPGLAPFFEDLGKVPTMTDDLFNWEEFCENLGAICMEVAFWKKDWVDDPGKFDRSTEYRKFAMSTFGPHDMELADQYYENILGTVDRELFERTCDKYDINFEKVIKELFDLDKSHPKRLRWKNEINHLEKVIQILNRHKKSAGDISDEGKSIFTGMHTSTYGEQSIFWNLIGMPGESERIASAEFVRSGLNFTMNASTMANFELLPLLMKVDTKIYGSYRPRINVPGTTNGNWEEMSPLSMEELLANEELIQKLRELNIQSDRYLD